MGNCSRLFPTLAAAPSEHVPVQKLDSKPCLLTRLLHSSMTMFIGYFFFLSSSELVIFVDKAEEEKILPNITIIYNCTFTKRTATRALPVYLSRCSKNALLVLFVLWVGISLFFEIGQATESLPHIHSNVSRVCSIFSSKYLWCHLSLMAPQLHAIFWPQKSEVWLQKTSPKHLCLNMKYWTLLQLPFKSVFMLSKLF